jgi:conflict system pore-forming effector with SLATT domain
MTDEERKLLQKWERETKTIYRAHYGSAIHAQRMSLRLGLPTVILSAVVGTSVFVAIGKSPSVGAQILVGSISVVVTILASLQTFLRFSERAERHQATAAAFAALNRLATHLLASPGNDEQLNKAMVSFRERWDELSSNAPTSFSDAWKEAKRREKEEQTRNEQSRAA